MRLWLSRGGALLVLFALVGVAWSSVAQPLISTILAHRDSIVHSQELLAKYEELNGARAKLDAELRAMRADQKSEGRLLSGSSAQLVGAELQNRIKEMIAGQNASLSSMQTLPVKEESGFQKISIGVTLKADLGALQSLLYTIESQQPYLFIEDLDVQTSAAFANSEKSDQLEIHFDVFGYLPGEI